MSTIFWKNFLKCLPTTTLCPQTFSFEEPLQDTTTTSTSSTTTTTSIIIQNNNNNNHLNSLYDSTSASASASTSNSLSTFSSLFTTSTSTASTSSDLDDPLPADFSTIFASQRFFFSSPGISNSIIQDKEVLHVTTKQETTTTTTAATDPDHESSLAGGVAVKKYSANPYMDFKHSMQEMIEYRRSSDEVKLIDWNYLHELLACYLTLNPKHTHKFIISAFADIVISLLSSSSLESDAPRTENDCRRQEHDDVLSRWLM